MNILQMLCKFILLASLMVCVGYSNEELLSISHNKVTYEYKKIPIIDKNTKELMFYKGEMKALDSTGSIVYFNQTSYSPGCEGTYKALSIIELEMSSVPMLKKSQTKKFITFCGSTGGRHNTLFILQPAFGLVSSLDYQDGPVNLKKDEYGMFRAKVNYQISIKFLDTLFSYPIFFTLKSIGNTVGFSDEIDNYTYEQYQKYGEMKIDDFNATSNLLYVTQALVVAMKSNNHVLYCKAVKLLESTQKYELNSLLNELNERFDTKYNITCKE